MTRRDQLPPKTIAATMDQTLTYADARDAAISRIAELLKHPDDLVTKVPGLHRRFAKEKAIIDAQLNQGVQSQLNNTQNGLETLSISEEEIQAIKKNLQKIDQLCHDASGQIQHFPRINKISRIHRNFVATQEKIQNLRELYKRINELQRLFDDDRRDILGPAENFLHIHYHLFRLEEFRDHTLHQARNSSQEVIITLRQYFRKLDVLVDDFQHYIWDLTRNILDLAKKHHGTVIVKLIKVIEAEERADEKAIAAEQAKATHGDLASEGTKWKLADGSPRTVKNYRVQFFDVLNEGLTERFDSYIAEYKDDPAAALEQTEFIWKDLALVADELVKRFPQKYKIFDYFVLQYHRLVYDMLGKMVKTDLSGGAILSIMKWVREYYSRMASDMGVNEELLEPQLLDGQEQALVDDYLKLVRKLLVEWTSNMLRTESKEFIERTKPPETNADGIYGLEAAVIMFKMIREQINIATDSNNSKVLYSVVSECHRVMKDSQRTWKELLQSELRKQIEHPDDVPEGLVDYVMALANDELRSGEFTEEIMNKVVPEVDSKYRTQVQEKLKTGVEGFMQTAEFAITILLEVTFNDIKPIFAQLFDQIWYDKEMMPPLIATLKDYFIDYQSHLHPYLFQKLVNKMLERFIIAYLGGMRNKGVRFRMPTCLSRIQSDVRLSFNFFAKYNAERLEQMFEAIEKVHTLLSSNSQMLPLDYYSLKQAYPDVSLAYVEDILSRRDDLTKSDMKEFMEGIKLKARDYQPDPTAEPTIFASIH